MSAGFLMILFSLPKLAFLILHECSVLKQMASFRSAEPPCRTALPFPAHLRCKSEKLGESSVTCKGSQVSVQLSRDLALPTKSSPGRPGLHLSSLLALWQTRPLTSHLGRIKKHSVTTGCLNSFSAPAWFRETLGRNETVG